MKTFTILALAILVVGLIAQSGGCDLHLGRPTIHFKDGTSVECNSVTALGDWVFCDQGTTTEDGIPLKNAYLSWNIDRIDGKVNEIQP